MGVSYEEQAAFVSGILAGAGALNDLSIESLDKLLTLTDNLMEGWELADEDVSSVSDAIRDDETFTEHYANKTEEESATNLAQLLRVMNTYGLPGDGGFREGCTFGEEVRKDRSVESEDLGQVEYDAFVDTLKSIFGEDNVVLIGDGTSGFINLGGGSSIE